MKSPQKQLLVAMISVAVAACSDSDGLQTQDGQTLSGQAADGYLKGALACLDLNLNAQCDESEPQAITDENGHFQISGLTALQVASYPLVVEVIDGVTEDMDNPGVAIDGEYALTAPAGYTFVSPITTMVKSQLESLGEINEQTKQQAEQAVQQLLGLDIDPNMDYVSAKSGNEQYAKAHKVAQAAAQMLKQANNEFNQDSQLTQGVSELEKRQWLAEQIVSAAQSIGEQVRQNPSLDPITLAGNIEIDTELAKSAIELKRERQLANAQTLLSLVTENQQGLFSYSYEPDYDGITYEKFNLSLDGQVYRDAATEYQYDETYTDDNGHWRPHTEIHYGTNWQLTSNGWQELEEEWYININQQLGRVELTHPDYPEISEYFVAEKMPLQGKRIREVLATSRDSSEWVGLVGTQNFTRSDAAAYRLSFTRDFDDYSLWQHNCDGQQGDCYQVWVSGQNSHGAVDFSDIISPQAASATNAFGPQIAYFENGGHVFVELVEQGLTANFYAQSNDWAAGVRPTPVYLTSATWAMEVVHGEQLLIVELPPSIQRINGDQARFFTIQDYQGVSMIHTGSLDRAGKTMDIDMMFNREANEEILAAFIAP